MNIEYSLSRDAKRQTHHAQTHHAQTRRRGQSLVGLLIVIVIGVAIYMMFLGPRKGNNGERQSSVLKKSMDKAEDVNTTNNLLQIQQGISMFKSENERFPTSLDEFRASTYGSGYPSEMFVDSVSKQPLNYDATTGQVSSPTGGLPGVAGSAPRDSNPGRVNLDGVPGAGTAPQSAPSEPQLPDN